MSQNVVLGMKATSKAALHVCQKLVTASGKPLSVVDHIAATVQIGQLKVRHNFIVVNSLVTPVILGTDFLQKHGLTLDFTADPVTVYQSRNELSDAEIPDKFSRCGRLNVLQRRKGLQLQSWRIKLPMW